MLSSLFVSRRFCVFFQHAIETQIFLKNSVRIINIAIDNVYIFLATTFTSSSLHKRFEVFLRRYFRDSGKNRCILNQLPETRQNQICNPKNQTTADDSQNSRKDVVRADRHYCNPAAYRSKDSDYQYYCCRVLNFIPYIHITKYPPLLHPPRSLGCRDNSVSFQQVINEFPAGLRPHGFYTDCRNAVPTWDRYGF